MANARGQHSAASMSVFVLNARAVVAKRRKLRNTGVRIPVACRLINPGPAKDADERLEETLRVGYQPDGGVLSKEGFLEVLRLAMKQLFGVVGGALDFDVMAYEPSSQSAIIKVPKSDATRVWAAAAMVGKHRDQECRLQVLQVSPFLLALATNSRSMQVG
eukprot:jgi/Mesvir1/15451/Mv06631-RA.1